MGEEPNKRKILKIKKIEKHHVKYVDFFLDSVGSALKPSSYPWEMENELSEHSHKASDKDALSELKLLTEFTSLGSLKKSIQRA